MDYIEEHLEEVVDTDKLVFKVSLSTFYFQRLFKRLVIKTAGEYIKLRRLAKASNLLILIFIG